MIRILRKDESGQFYVCCVDALVFDPSDGVLWWFEDDTSGTSLYVIEMLEVHASALIRNAFCTGSVDLTPYLIKEVK